MGGTSSKVPQPETVHLQVDIGLGGSAVHGEGLHAHPPALRQVAHHSAQWRKRLKHCLLLEVGAPADPACSFCSVVYLPLDWLALGLGPSLWPPRSALLGVQGSLQVYKG